MMELPEIMQQIDFDTRRLQVYHLGIIDYLQLWNFNKRCERIIKSLIHGSRIYNTVSAVPPDMY